MIWKLINHALELSKLDPDFCIGDHDDAPVDIIPCRSWTNKFPHFIKEEGPQFHPLGSSGRCSRYITKNVLKVTFSYLFCPSEEISRIFGQCSTKDQLTADQTVCSFKNCNGLTTKPSDEHQRQRASCRCTVLGIIFRSTIS